MNNWRKGRIAAVILATLVVLSASVLAYINRLSFATESSGIGLTDFIKTKH